MQSKSIRSRDLEEYLEDLEVRAENLLWTHNNVHLSYSHRLTLSVEMLVDDEFLSFYDVSLLGSESEIYAKLATILEKYDLSSITPDSPRGTFEVSSEDVTALLREVVSKMIDGNLSEVSQCVLFSLKSDDSFLPWVCHIHPSVIRDEYLAALASYRKAGMDGK